MAAPSPNHPITRLGALPEDLHPSACQSREEARACRLYPHYQQELAAQGLLDFDDLVMVRALHALCGIALLKPITHTL